MPFVEIPESQVKAGRMEAFLLAAAADDARHSVADEPGCRQFEVVLPEGSGNIVVYEDDDSRAACEGRLETPHLARFREAFPSLIVEEEPVRFAERQYP